MASLTFFPSFSFLAAPDLLPDPSISFFPSFSTHSSLPSLAASPFGSQNPAACSPYSRPSPPPFSKGSDPREPRNPYDPIPALRLERYPDRLVPVMPVMPSFGRMVRIMERGWQGVPAGAEFDLADIRAKGVKETAEEELLWSDDKVKERRVEVRASGGKTVALEGGGELYYQFPLSEERKAEEDGEEDLDGSILSFTPRRSRASIEREQRAIARADIESAASLPSRSSSTSLDTSSTDVPLTPTLDSASASSSTANLLEVLPLYPQPDEYVPVRRSGGFWSSLGRAIIDFGDYLERCQDEVRASRIARGLEPVDEKNELICLHFGWDEWTYSVHPKEPKEQEGGEKAEGEEKEEK